MFDSLHENRDPGREGAYVYPAIVEAAIECLLEQVIGGSEGAPRVLIGSTKHFPTRDYPTLWSTQPAPEGVHGETMVMSSLKQLIFYGARKDVTRDTHDAYITFLQANFDRILLPYMPNGLDFMLFDVVFNEAMGGPSVKVWDPANLMAGLDSTGMLLLQYVMGVFFAQGSAVDVRPTRGQEDPGYDDTHGSGPFVFFTMTHLASGRLPPAAGADDEAFVRSFMWGSVVHGTPLPLPKLKFIE